MNLLLIQKEGVDLYNTLLSSETSRGILRFYRPERRKYGMHITIATLGNALSLASELKWYVRRYVAAVLFEISENLYCTHEFAMDIYEREEKMHEPWNECRLMGIKNGIIAAEKMMKPGSSGKDYPDFAEDMDEVLEIWCTEREAGKQIPVHAAESYEEIV